MACVITSADAGYVYGATVDLVVKSCPVCGITYAMPQRLDEQAREYNRAEWPKNTLSFYCPNGHVLSYVGRNDEQEAKRQLQAERDRAGRLASQRDQAQASAKAQRGAATRARNERDRQAKRVKQGVCPCCNRTFKQLARHMESQHPDFEPGGEG